MRLACCGVILRSCGCQGDVIGSGIRERLHLVERRAATVNFYAVLVQPEEIIFSRDLRSGNRNTVTLIDRGITIGTIKCEIDNTGCFCHGQRIRRA